MSSDHGSGHASAVNSVSDSWEDDVLIAAYNKAVSNLHKQKEKSVNENQYQTSNTSTTNNENTNYKIGDVIKARYYNDMKFYPAIIKSIDIDKFNVEFLDYGNCQLTFYYDIIKNKNTSDSEKETGEICSDEEETCINQNGIRGSSDSLSTPLPSIPLPQNVHKMFEEIYKLTPPCEGKRSLKADAMLSMLSSWYISGYYTGFYHGLEAKK